jgi:hypothetical protein
MKEENGGERGVQPLNMVDPSTCPLQTPFGPVFVSRQSGQAMSWQLGLSVLKRVPVLKDMAHGTAPFRSRDTILWFLWAWSPRRSFQRGSSLKDELHLEIEFSVRESKEGQRW